MPASVWHQAIMHLCSNLAQVEPLHPHLDAMSQAGCGPPMNIPALKVSSPSCSNLAMRLLGVTAFACRSMLAEAEAPSVGCWTRQGSQSMGRRRKLSARDAVR